PDRLDHLVGHHLLGGLRPLPGDRGADVAVQPGRVDLRALEVRAGRLEQHRLATARQDAVADEDVVLPVALEDARDVADVLADEAHDGTEIVLLHLHSSALEAVAAQAVAVVLNTRRGSCSCGLPRNDRSMPLPVWVRSCSVMLMVSRFLQWVC